MSKGSLFIYFWTDNIVGFTNNEKFLKNNRKRIKKNLIHKIDISKLIIFISMNLYEIYYKERNTTFPKNNEDNLNKIQKNTKT